MSFLRGLAEPLTGAGGLELQSPDTPQRNEQGPAAMQQETQTPSFIATVSSQQANQAREILPRFRRTVAKGCPRAKYFIEQFWPRSCVHLFLYVGAMVNFAFMWMWISELANFQCGTAATIEIGFIRIGAFMQCTIQIVGTFVFGSSFIGTISMIIYYDDSTKTLLKQKREKLVQVSVEMMRTLSDSLHLVVDLLGLLQDLSEEVMLHRWEDCAGVLKRCSIAVQTQDKLASSLTQCMYEVMAFATRYMEQSNFSEYRASAFWIHDNEKANEALQVPCSSCKAQMGEASSQQKCSSCQKEGAQYSCSKGCSHHLCQTCKDAKRVKFDITDSKGEVTHFLVVKKMEVQAPPALESAAPTAPEGDVSEGSGSDSEGSIEEMLEEIETTGRGKGPKFEFYLHGAEPAPDAKTVLRQMMLKSAAYDPFARGLLVKPWENWVAIFEQQCRAFTDEFRKAGVYINLTQDLLERQVLGKRLNNEAMQATCPRCTENLRVMRTEDYDCTACRNLGTMYSCERGCVHYCQACKEGLPVNRKLQAIYVSSQQGVLQAIYREEIEEEGTGDAALEKVRNWQSAISAAGQLQSLGGQSRRSMRRSTIGQNQIKKAQPTFFFAVAGVKGEKKSGLGSFSTLLTPMDWYFCLPCSGLRSLSCCVIAILRGLKFTGREVNESLCDEEAPDETPRCSIVGPKKRCAVLCWHMDVNSYLHERLLVGATFSLVYAFIELAFVLSIMLHGCTAYKSDAACFEVLVKKACGATFLFVYFVNTLCCLLNLEHLDANVEFARDIRKLEDLRDGLAEFNKLRMQAEGLKDLFGRIRDAGDVFQTVHKEMDNWKKAPCPTCRENKKGFKLKPIDDKQAECTVCKKQGTRFSCSNGCSFFLCHDCEADGRVPEKAATDLLKKLEKKIKVMSTPSTSTSSFASTASIPVQV